MNAPRRRPRSDRTKAQIADVAIRMFEARGFEEVTVDEIAAEMGISRRTIFRHFPTKADIVIDPIRIGFRALPDGLRAQAHNLPLGEALANSLAVLVEGLEKRRELLARHLPLVMGAAMLRAMARAMTDAAVVDLRHAILSRMADGETNLLNASVWAEMMFVIAYGGRERWLTCPEQPIAPVMTQSYEAAAALTGLLHWKPGEHSMPEGH